MKWFGLTPLTNLPPPAFADGASARAWLQSAKGSAATAPLDALTEQLERLQGASLDGFARATLLETLRHDALVTLAAQRQRFAYVPRPLNAAAQSALIANQRAWSALTIGYLQCIETFLDGDATVAATAAHRAMMGIKLALEDHFFAGVEPPALLWNRALKVVELAAVKGFLRVAVADPTLTDQGRSTVLQQYTLLALTGLSDPYSLPPTEYGALQKILMRWRDLPEFSPRRDDDSKRRWVNLRLLEGGHRQAAENPLWLDVSLVRGKLRRRIDSLQAGEKPEALGLGREIRSAPALVLLDRVRLRLHEAYNPAAAGPRQATGDSIFIATSIEDGFSLFTGVRYNANPKAGAATDRILHERMALFGQDSLIMDVASEKPKFGEEWLLGSAGARADLGIAISNNVDSVRNAVRLGQLVALRSGEHLALGKVTRALVRQAGTVDVSVLPLPGGKPVSVEGHVYDQSGQVHFPILMLPATGESGAPPAVIFMPNGVGAKIKQPIETNLQTPRKMKLSTAVDAGPNFDCYRFDPI